MPAVSLLASDKKKARQCCGGRPFVLNYKINSGRHPRSCGAMVMMMPDSAEGCFVDHEEPV
jgi:hypothetical protein